MTLFKSALLSQNDSQPPIWMMRQAGRYHSRYQALRQKHSFMDLCRVPELAAEVALGPVQDFGFDAAILFSDLLFPLDTLGMGLSYDPAPTLAWHLRSESDLKKLTEKPDVRSLAFQSEAMRLTRERLQDKTGLIGFVGGPLTLFCYAADGAHKGELAHSRAGLAGGWFDSFCEKLIPLLADNMALQARAGADGIAVLDTCAGEFSAAYFKRSIVPQLGDLLERFKKLCPDTPVVYYSKGTTAEHWDSLSHLPIQGLGVDWNSDLPDVIERFGERYSIQGNFNPSWLLEDQKTLAQNLRRFFSKMSAVSRHKKRGWICGLGHGVLPSTPEANVRLFLQIAREAT